MMDEKILPLLGIAQKSGKLLSGYELCSAAIKAGKARAAVISGDSADNTRKKFIRLCKNYNVPYIIYGDKYRLGMAIGKYRRTVLVIIDKGLAGAILEKYYSEKSGKINGGGNFNGENKSICPGKGIKQGHKGFIEEI